MLFNQSVKKNWNRQGESLFLGKSICWKLQVLAALPADHNTADSSGHQTVVLFVRAKCWYMAHSAVFWHTVQIHTVHWHTVQKFVLFVLTACWHLEIGILCFHTFRSQLLLACVLFGRVQMPIHSMFKYFSCTPLSNKTIFVTNVSEKQLKGQDQTDKPLLVKQNKRLIISSKMRRTPCTHIFSMQSMDHLLSC